MSNITTGIDGLAAVIARELEQWQIEKQTEVKEAIRKRSREARSKIRAASPKDSGKYAKGWSVKTVYESTRGLRVVLHNTAAPGLTHLLEHGHAIKPGTGRVASRVHIGPVEDEVNAAIQDDIRKIYGGG